MVDDTAETGFGISCASGAGTSALLDLSRVSSILFENEIVAAS